MKPAELRREDFSAYPPIARRTAIDHLTLLQRLPLAFVPLLLRELIAYDWKFPAERQEMDQQLTFLSGLDAQQLAELTADFRKLQLSADLAQIDWVNAPAQFSERLSAYLWASNQIDAFRAASVDFVRQLKSATPVPQLPAQRLAVVVLGEGVQANTYPLFRKLRPHGTYFSNLNPENGNAILEEHTAERATAHPAEFAHWYIDGGGREVRTTGVTCVSYQALNAVRSALVQKMQNAIRSGAGPEALRTSLAALRPRDLGLSEIPSQAVLNRFQVSVLTEGSGTQLFSTTFVQWSAREVLRRAQPLTLFTRYAPRRRDQTIEELAGGKPSEGTDPQGSLVDADMGAYYTWVNQQRLPAAENDRFLVWFEGRNEALGISPKLAAAATDTSRLRMTDLLKRLT